VVPMVLVVPLLKSGADPAAAATQIGLALGKAAVVVFITVALARFVVPRVLARVDASRSREIFLLAILGLCIGTAWLTSRFGLSLALGAFLGGMVVADTEYGHRAMGDILPLRDAFVSVFFISLGMLFDVRVLASAPGAVALALGGFVLVKGVLAAFAAVVMKFPARAAWLAGIGLAQFSEFGFVLARLGETSGLVDAGITRPVLAAGVISMFLTPLLVRAAPHLTAGERLLAPLERLLGVRAIGDEEATGAAAPTGHVVLVGFGVAGRLAARALAACGIPYVVLELNADTVRTARAAGLPVYYGDATSAETLGHAHLADARALVLLINDPGAASRVVDTATRCAPDVPVLARTRYLAERAQLVRLGARDAVAEEVEGAVEIIARLLRWVEVPRTIIDEQLEDMRTGAQESERTPRVPRPLLGEQLALADLKIESALVRAGSPAAGRSPLELDLRARTGALVVAVRRREHLVEQPDAATRFEIDDVVYLVGPRAAMNAALPLFAAPSSPSDRPAPRLR
jgi:monovalent cation:H+ antiporter-2, CPA2 family